MRPSAPHPHDLDRTDRRSAAPDVLVRRRRQRQPRARHRLNRRHAHRHGAAAHIRARTVRDFPENTGKDLAAEMAGHQQCRH